MDEWTERLFCLTVDVEWAHPEVLASLVSELDRRKLSATFFCTHAGITIPGHERALHPNYRPDGDTVRMLPKNDRASEEDVFRHVIQHTHGFCPEAVGVRSHSLFYDSRLLPLYQEVGLQYDSTYLLPLAPRLQPVMKEYDLLELPIYYNDHFDLKAGATDFDLHEMKLDRPGLKVFLFHPNLVYLNASSNEQYLASKAAYRDPARLAQMRGTGKGVRALFLKLLDWLASGSHMTATLGEVNTRWREERT